MHLHRLEVAGFKSFPDRAELRFDRGVTAIVGPNGCGKSNIVDAITWVLGEQSARTLRGERMEDVIFGGSEARKPTAAAEVRLGLSSVAVRGGRPDEGHGGNGHAAAGLELEDEPTIVRDIEVSRRLYRSGESEYLIDGEVCRLRDVQDLLMDAGVGVKAYAVIEQGKIGQILSAKPTERRQLIEEAAGVTKFKSRRRAAELKLEAAQQNLTRIDDIVFEIERQRGALKRQAAKARRHQRLRDALRAWEKRLFADKFAALTAAIERARVRLAEARSAESDAAAHVGALEARLERLRLDLAELEARATAAREAAHARELAIERRQQQIQFDRQQVDVLGTAGRELAVEIERLVARLEPARDELAQREEAVVRVGRERDAAAASWREAEDRRGQAAREIEGLEADVEAARNEVFAAINAATALTHVIERADAARERIAADIVRFDAEAADVRVERERAQRDRDTAATSLATAREALRAVQERRATREAELANARLDRERRARELRGREQQLAGLTGRLHSLEELEAARAGYGDAARLVLAEGGERVRHLGAVADQLEVDRPYERAVEAVLGDLLQYIVVPDHAAIEEGLRLVRERGAGRCGFVVVGTPGAEAGAPASAPVPGLVALASVSRIVAAGEAALREALGSAWIAESFETARRAALVTDVPVVTMDGDVFRGSRVVTGGGRDEARGILATKREIKELRERIAEEQSALQVLTAELLAFDSVISQIDASIAEMVTAQHGHEKAIVGIDLQLARAAEEDARLTRRLGLIGTERQRAEEERHTLDDRAEEARASIVMLEQTQLEADERLTVSQRRLMDAREALDELNRRAAESKAVHATLAERADALAGDVQRLAEGLRELDDRIAGRREERERTMARQEELRIAIAESERLLDQDARQFEDLRQAVRDADDRVTALHTDTAAVETDLREARRVLGDARAVVGQLDVERATAESDLSHLSASCLDTLQLALEEVAAEVARLRAEGVATPAVPVVADDEIEEAEGIAAETAEPAAVEGRGEPTAEEAIADLRRKIERLGPVNMMAIQQFDELEKRHTFLTGQRQDLLDSITATNEAIKRIERTTRERFQEAFTSINANFERTFSTLFGGGRAGLILLDEGDLLESGIDIIAQPPGKRLQYVQLLSGGEKALTAMALMFAIFQYRPSPFCLLDEIDAPLDDANIGRFVEMLRGMQKYTQFVLITHNRKTMEIADRLYGVTMEEPGVSKLISIQLN